MTTKLLIFGITGDLSRRKLLPALGRIVATDEFHNLQILGISRHDVDLENLIADETLRQQTQMYRMNLDKIEDYEHLAHSLELSDDDQLLIYLSVPPAASGQIIELLGRSGINTPHVKLLMEKPFGVDLASAREMSERIAKYFDDSQVFRIDHYMAKEMAQNIVTIREQNAVFAHLWDNQSIEKIEINAFESIDIEGRTQFYEQTGALRDVVQGHLMELLALVLMDLPNGMHWHDVAPERAKALAAIQPVRVDEVTRAQYEGYASEVGAPGSATETFVSVALHSDAPKWQGVPLLLTTGKALDEKRTEIKVHFKKFHHAQTNCLTFRIQPHEGVQIELNTKKPGYEHALERKLLSFAYPAEVSLPDAYELVIVDAIRGYQHLFTSNEEVLRAWEILQPIVAHWEETKEPIRTYAKGSSAESVLMS